MYYFFFASHTSRLFMSNPLWVCLFLSVCLSLPCPSFLGSIPGYFPTRMSYPCWEHVSLLPPLTPSSSHTGCLMAPSTTCCMKAPVSTSALVTKSALVTIFWWFAGICWFIALTHLSLCCHHFMYSSSYLCICYVMKPVMICHLSCCQTLSWTRRRRWSLPWTLLVEWPSYTHWNRWSLATISTARVSW